MDTAWSRFKRTLTFRRKKKHEPDSGTNAAGKPYQWLEDEKKVREGTCSFQVKYLGNVEVLESRGMLICEDAIKKLKARTRGKQQRAILYVSGDALRVVDEITKLKSPAEQKGLIVDQTIEKVSFCSPDRNHEKAFAYICRDGTTRRWLCHGFLAVRDSGERLSHAVGCAFAVCLERKQQRERDCSVKAEFSDTRGTTFTRIGSFRQATLTEKLLDPQISQVVEPPPAHQTVSTDDSNLARAIPRPRASEDLMYRRYSSMRLPSSTSAFDYSSLTTSSASASGPVVRPITSSSSSTPLNPNNPLLLPPPPVSTSTNFRRSTSLRLDSSTAANAVARRQCPLSASSQFSDPSAPSQMNTSLSASSQLGAASGILPFPKSCSANAGFGTPLYGNVPTLPPSIPEEDPWSSPSTANNQVAVAADAVTQLCEQLTAGLLTSPSQTTSVHSPVSTVAVAQPAYSTVPSVVTTPLNNVISLPSTAVSAVSPVGSAPSARNPFLANTNGTAPSNSMPAASTVNSAPVSSAYGVVSSSSTANHTTTHRFAPDTAMPNNYFPPPSQWQAFPNNVNNTISLSVATPVVQQQNQQPQAFTSLAWPSQVNDPFAQSPLSSSTSSNPFKDAPFIANV